MAKARASGDQAGLLNVSVQHQSPAAVSGSLMLPWSLSITHWYQSSLFHAAQIIISKGKLVCQTYLSVGTFLKCCTEEAKIKQCLI